MTDILFALRTFRKNPGFTFAAIAALALGIGASTAIFSVVNVVLLRPLSYRAPEQLVFVWERIPNFGPGLMGVPAPDYVDFRDLNRVFEGISAFRTRSFNLSGGSEPLRVSATRVSHNLFSVLGAQPAQGRAFTAEEDVYGNENVAVLSYGLWMSRFGGDAGVVGRTIQLDGRPHTVVGVMPREFQFPPRDSAGRFEPADLWVPFALTPQEVQARGDNFGTNLVARLKSGVTLDAATQDAHRIAQILHQKFPPRIRGAFELTGHVTSLGEEVIGGVRRSLWVLLGAVGFLLLIGCANVANLLLARSAARAREIAVRTALGAGRARLIRQLLSESLLLAIAGGALGLLLASWGSELLIAFSPGNIPRLDQAGVDWRVLSFTLAVVLGTVILFGLAPAIEASKVDLNSALKDASTRGTSRRNRLRHALVVCEVALSMILLTGAGLLIKSFLSAANVDPGFRRENLFSASVAPPLSQYPDAPRVMAFYDELLRRVANIPGVTSAALATNMPMAGSWSIMFTPESQTQAAWGRTIAGNTMIMGDYFAATGIPLKRGRLFTPADADGRPLVAIVNETMAARFFGGVDAVGKRVKWGSPQSTRDYMTIVGVVGDVRQAGLDQPVEPAIYMPWKQREPEAIALFARSMRIAVRSAMAPEAVTAGVRREVAALDPSLPLFEVAMMEQVVSNSVAPRRFPMLLVSVFAALALVLASIGIYGVMAYAVRRHTSEIGIRVALGARPGDVLAMVIRRGMLLVAGGLLAGGAGAFALTRLMTSLLYETQPSDPAVFGAVALLLTAVALAACWIPARAATRIDPLVALRHE